MKASVTMDSLSSLAVGIKLKPPGGTSGTVQDIMVCIVSMEDLKLIRVMLVVANTAITIYIDHIYLDLSEMNHGDLYYN